MCIILKLDYAKFGVSNLFFKKITKKKPFFFGGGVDSTPLANKRVNQKLKKDFL